jgi:hypothetical protein
MTKNHVTCLTVGFPGGADIDRLSKLCGQLAFRQSVRGLLPQNIGSHAVRARHQQRTSAGHVREEKQG